MAFNLGRPTLFAGDETIRHCKEFLDHPLSIETDSRIVAACELLSARGEPDLMNDANAQFGYINHSQLSQRRPAYPTWTRSSRRISERQTSGSSTGTSTMRAGVWRRACSCGKLVSPSTVQREGRDAERVIVITGRCGAE